jgi:chromate reductase
MSKILVIVGSLREGSYNRRVAHAMTRLPAAQGHSFEFADVGSLPLYDQDTDSDQPEPARSLKQQIRDADGVLFATPEYNRSIPGVLKNAIDHASRPFGDSAWKDKPAGIFGVSPGKMSTALAQQHLRNILAAVFVPVLHGPEAFLQWNDALVTDEGEIGEDSQKFLNGWMEKFLQWVETHKG